MTSLSDETCFDGIVAWAVITCGSGRNKDAVGYVA